MERKHAFFVFLDDCGLLFLPQTQPWIAMQQGDRRQKATDMKRGGEREGKRGR